MFSVLEEKYGPSLWPMALACGQWPWKELCIVTILQDYATLPLLILQTAAILPLSIPNASVTNVK